MTTLAERFAALRPSIDREAREAIDALLAEIGRTAGADAFVDTALAATRSGKRFRALLAHFGASLASGRPLGEDPVGSLGAALELYQASALAHDDLIDHARTRRGAPTPHVRLAGVHRDAGWQGSADEFGAAGAVLVGDLLFSAAERAIGRQCEDLDPADAARLLARYSTMHAEVALGQYLDVRAEHLPLDLLDDAALSIEDAMEVVLRKSAHYSIVHPALLGAIAAGGDDALLASLDEILTPWGIAFQLRDDDLGVFGDPGTTGKPAGDDLREGKRTVLLALAWRAAADDERRALVGVLGDADAPDAAVAEAAAIIERRGRAAHERLIESLILEGEKALESAGFSPAEREDLLELARIVTARKS
ncbi:polyprenyl synthetase family protein [Actinomyces culturomici]|uniref:polyprenyl synthetase family protein n=1 Tax=Actinomyces culturomici TaxID=1926276 RepID=UPI000E20A0E9|nr:polyprenyl synthetase family protein [Actinomyces culturomici]